MNGHGLGGCDEVTQVDLGYLLDQLQRERLAVAAMPLLTTPPCRVEGEAVGVVPTEPVLAVASVCADPVRRLGRLGR